MITVIYAISFTVEFFRQLYLFITLRAHSIMLTSAKPQQLTTVNHAAHMISYHSHHLSPILSYLKTQSKILSSVNIVVHSSPRAAIIQTLRMYADFSEYITFKGRVHKPKVSDKICTISTK